MDAVIVNLKDFGLQTPEQVLRVFFSLYNETSVRAELWKVFVRYSVNDERGINALDDEEKKIALLFDHLIDLVGAVEALRGVK